MYKYVLVKILATCRPAKALSIASVCVLPNIRLYAITYPTASGSMQVTTAGSALQYKTDFVAKDGIAAGQARFDAPLVANGDIATFASSRAGTLKSRTWTQEDRISAGESGPNGKSSFVRFLGNGEMLPRYGRVNESFVYSAAGFYDSFQILSPGRIGETVTVEFKMPVSVSINTTVIADSTYLHWPNSDLGIFGDMSAGLTIYNRDTYENVVQGTYVVGASRKASTTLGAPDVVGSYFLSNLWDKNKIFRMNVVVGNVYNMHMSLQTGLDIYNFGNISGAFKCDIDASNSLYWGGITSVLGSSGVKLDDVLIWSESGMDYNRDFSKQSDINRVPDDLATGVVFSFSTLCSLIFRRRQQLSRDSSCA